MLSVYGRLRSVGGSSVYKLLKRFDQAQSKKGLLRYFRFGYKQGLTVLFRLKESIIYSLLMVKHSGVMCFTVKLPGQRLPPTGRSVVLQVHASFGQVEQLGARRGVAFEQIHNIFESRVMMSNITTIVSLNKGAFHVISCIVHLYLSSDAVILY